MKNPLREGVRARQKALLAACARADLTGDLYGAYALINLAAHTYVREANEKLREVAQWFLRPHPRGRDPLGECDFAAIKLAGAYCRFKPEGLLEQETQEAIRDFFLTFDFQSKYTSENHLLLFHTSRYLMAAVWPDAVFGRYGLTGQTLFAAESAYLREFLTFRAQQGWDEFDSGCYFAPVWEALCTLHDEAPEESIRTLARMMMNVRLADMAVDSLEGMYCGAHGRIYERHALDHRWECTFFLQHLYFGGERFEKETMIPEALLCTFCPEPIVERIFSDRKMPYRTRERVHLHCSTYRAPQRPLPRENVSLRKITYMTPRYALGCVQGEDSYAAGSPAAWHSGHQQHEWDLTFAGGDTDCRIFTHHPGHSGAEGAEHGYWTGDLFCGCGCHYQHGRAVLALHDIPEEEPYGWIHAYLPQARFERVVQNGNSVYVSRGGVYAMLRFTSPCHFAREGVGAGKELICEGRKIGAALEVCEAEEFDSFEAFMHEMEENRLFLDRARMELTYQSKKNGTLTLARGRRTADGREEDLNYPAFDSPYLQSEWDSGVITLTWGKERLVCDFFRMDMR